MKQFISLSLTCALLAPIFASLFQQPALATRLSTEMKAAVSAAFPESKVRLDGALETKAGQLYLPLIPVPTKAVTDKKPADRGPALRQKGAADKSVEDKSASDKGASDKAAKAVQLREKFPETGENPDALFFSNDWCYLRLIKKGSVKTTINSSALPEKLRKQLFSCRFAPDLIVPENFALPRVMKPLAGELAISILPEAVPKPKTIGVANAPDAGGADAAGKAKPVNATAHGAVFISSPGSGKITMLDDKTLDKLTEFPTEGTPAGMTVADGRLYIADQGKSRILILDPKKRQFLGQIDLTPKSAPKGLAALPNGKLIYASESAAGNIDVIETDTGKVLLKTKVQAGPSKVVMAPSGNLIIVLNPPSGQATLITTNNQKVAGVVKVGANPNAVVFSKDGAFAYVSNRVSNTVTIIDVGKRQPVGNLDTSAGPTGLTLSKEGDKLFVANAKDNSISIFDLEKRVKIQDVKLPLDVDFPSSLFLMPDGEHVLVSSASTDAVGIFNVSKMEFEKQPVIGNTSDEMLWLSLE
ncbi:MAG TPA: beta-propeller fold lactonase family protein [Drouetiella sp.]|jgi:YVTN family beta-propeller protein